jgi:hypothetical protein
VFGIESIEPNTALERLRALHDYALFPELFNAIADGAVVYYEPALREFTIPNANGVSAYVLNHCPLTGRRVPWSLRDEWFDALEAVGAFPVDEMPPWTSWPRRPTAPMRGGGIRSWRAEDGADAGLSIPLPLRERVAREAGRVRGHAGLSGQAYQPLIRQLR